MTSISENTLSSNSSFRKRILGLNKRPYFTEEEAENIKKYRYKGTDEGILYIYFFSPLAEKLVSWTPEWVAPNTITFAGLMCVTLPLLILYTFYGSSLIGDIPSWFIVL